MSPDYQVKPLSPDTAAHAYPVIQAAWPHITLKAWIDYFNNLRRSFPAARDMCGVMAAENPNGYIHGLFCYIVHTALNQKAVLVVDNFVALDTGDRAAAIGALLAAMDDLARNLHCSAIHTDIPDSWIIRHGSGRGLLDHLEIFGHSRAFVRFRKAIGDAHSSGQNPPAQRVGAIRPEQAR